MGTGLEIALYTIAAASTASAVYSGEVQKDAANKSASAQNRARNEQAASNAAEAARERRQQIREERVKQARIMQASSNTGVAESSGEFGAIGSIATQVNSNIGFNLGAIQRAENISIFNQQAADANLAGQKAAITNQQVQAGLKLAGNIFKAS